MAKWNIQPVIQGLQQARRDWRASQQRSNEIGGREFPSKAALNSILNDLCGILFPMRLGPADLRQEAEDYYIAYTLERVLNQLYVQVELALSYENKRQVPQPSIVESSATDSIPHHQIAKK